MIFSRLWAALTKKRYLTEWGRRAAERRKERDAEIAKYYSDQLDAVWAINTIIELIEKKPPGWMWKYRILSHRTAYQFAIVIRAWREERAASKAEKGYAKQA